MAGSLYVHVPFCVRKCVYCDFLSIPFDEGVARKYVEALVRELKMLPSRKLSTLYLGGGTPSILSADELSSIFKTVQKSFGYMPDAEVTVEANPGTLDKDKLSLLDSLGVNRLSIGVQSLNDKELKLLGRSHSAAEALRSLESLSLPNFSVDLIYGIPGQSMQSWLDTLERVLEFSPPHVSAYELTAEPDTPLYEALASGELTAPSDDLVVEMSEAATDSMAQAGLVRYEISNFACKGSECRHNLNYWHRGEYMGAGAGAHSFVGGRRKRNTGYVFKYIELLERKNLPVEDDVAVMPEDEIKEVIFLGLRLSRGIDLKRAGFLREASASLVSEGLMEVDGGSLRLTSRGLPVANAVIVRLFENLGLS